MSYTTLITILKGGPGSGNWGHAGRLGKRGGSVPKSGAGAAMSIRTGRDAAQRQAQAKNKVTTIGHIKVIGGTPDQLNMVKEALANLPDWHTSLVNDKVVTDTLNGYRLLPEEVFNEFNTEARKAMQTGSLMVEFTSGSPGRKVNPITGATVEGIGGHIPNYIKLHDSLHGDQLKGVLHHELGHQVSYLGAKIAPTAELKYGRAYKPAGEAMDAARKRDLADLEHTLGIQGAASERYQRWSAGLKAINRTTSKTYNPIVNREERFAEAFRIYAAGQGDTLTPGVQRYISKFFNKKPPVGAMGVD